MSAFLTRVEDAIARTEALPAATRRAIFTEFTPARIRAEAAALAARAAAGEAMPLFGTLISVKDLYDEAGQVTGAGSRLLAERGSVAGADAVAVARLRRAGALMFGRTSMSEFAYSGVGLNPHHGTPESALAAGVIPGGSSSGAAVSVALRLCDAALGTDTGGSLRIPAAANGLWGLKPSADLIDATGIFPLAGTFDSAGAMAGTEALLRQVTEVMAGAPLDAPAPGRLRLGLPTGAFTEGLSPEVATLFAAETARIAALGHELVPVEMAEIGAGIGLNKIIVAAEALAIHHADLGRLETVGDPRVLSRIRFALTLAPGALDAALSERARLVALFEARMQGLDALLVPTLMQLPPTIAAVEANFDALNAAMLRNTSLVNLVDGCAVALPTPGAEPRWSMTMLVGRKGADAALLAAARAIA